MNASGCMNISACISSESASRNPDRAFLEPFDISTKNKISENFFGIFILKLLSSIRFRLVLNLVIFSRDKNCGKIGYFFQKFGFSPQNSFFQNFSVDYDFFLWWLLLQKISKISIVLLFRILLFRISSLVEEGSARSRAEKNFRWWRKMKNESRGARNIKTNYLLFVNWSTINDPNVPWSKMADIGGPTLYVAIW